jgi:Ca2+-transporting ATPase
MATRNAVDGRSLMMVKGAYEALRPMAVNGGDLALLDAEVGRMASEGLRVLALGMGQGSIEDPQGPALRLVGLVGFLDPPKAGVREAVEAARHAGIRVIMITGDHPETARAVARDVGIWREGDGLLSGRELEAMSDEDLLPALRHATVLARILPEHKYRVVKVLQAGGEIVAVTGDGVNDVPALKAADLGIAMGEGTEAAKGVAKMVIIDNDLGVIIGAIRNGRVIAANIRKVIYYLVSTSMGEIVLISSAIMAGLPLPLLPTQVLWVNLVTDGAQDKTFPFAKEEGDVMSRPPVRPEKQFFDRRQLSRTAFFGLSMGILALMMFIMLRDRYEAMIVGTITFTTVVAVQWVNGVQAQKEREPFLVNIRRSLGINPYIFVGATTGFILQLIAIYAIPGWFGTTPLGLEHWLYVVVACGVMFALVEARKWAELLVDRAPSRMEP